MIDELIEDNLPFLKKTKKFLKETSTIYLEKDRSFNLSIYAYCPRCPCCIYKFDYTCNGYFKWKAVNEPRSISLTLGSFTIVKLNKYNSYYIHKGIISFNNYFYITGEALEFLLNIIKDEGIIEM